MKLFVQTNTAQDKLASVQCNVCGKEVAQNEWGYFMDYVSMDKLWGYHSPYDGQAHELDVCVDCYRSWVGGFEIPPMRSEEVMV